VAGDVLEVGDVMRWDAKLVEQLQVQDDEQDVLVRVTHIARESDGTVTLWLERADDLPESKVGS
jgi:hypothetical protein